MSSAFCLYARLPFLTFLVFVSLLFCAQCFGVSLTKLLNDSTVYKEARLNLTRRAREVLKYSREYLNGSSRKPLLPL